MASRRHSVLIADDYEADRLFLKQAISLHAPLLQVIGEVEDGAQVIAYLRGDSQYADREKHPMQELLIMDGRMPRMTGIDVLEWLKTQDFPMLKVALLADSSAVEYQHRMHNLGIHHFYAKTQNLDDLVAVVKSLQIELEKKPEEAARANATEIPSLVLGDMQFESVGMPVIVVWSGTEVSRFLTLEAAKAAIVMGYRIEGSSRAHGARLYVWGGKAWQQTFC